MRTKHGFTIVELLIVIVVIGILASITVVTYNGVNERARNVQIITAAKAWANAMKLYVAEKGDRIDMYLTPVCLGGPDDYPVTANFAKDDCIGSWTNYQAEYSLEFSEILAAYGGTPKVTWDYGFEEDPWSYEKTRGIRYSRSGLYPTTNSQQIGYTLYGDVDCVIAGAIKKASTAEATSCDLPVELWVES